MNEKQFLDVVRLASDLPVRSMLDQHELALNKLFGVLSGLIPDHRSTFEAIQYEYQAASNRFCEDAGDMEAVFAGKGPVARKLEEHLSMLKYFSGDSAATAKMQELHNSFNFKPTSSQKQIIELNDFIVSLPSKVMDKPFTSARSGVLLDASFENWPSAVHYTVDGAFSCMTLHSKPRYERDYRITLILGADNGCAIRIWHPLEELWFAIDKHVLPDLTQRLRDELITAIEAASEDTSDLDFESEVASLRQRAKMVFDNQALLPVQISTARNEQIYCRPDVDRSHIVAAVGDKAIFFWNTTGAYSFQDTTVAAITSGDSTATMLYSVNSSDISSSLKRALILRSRSILDYLTNRVNELMSENKDKTIVQTVSGKVAQLQKSLS